MNAPRNPCARLRQDKRDTITTQVMGDASVVPDQGFRIDFGLGGQCALAGGRMPLEA